MFAPGSIARIGGSEARVERLRPALGTWVSLEARASTEAAALAGLEAAYLTIRRIERQLHPSREGSEIRTIQAVPLGKRVLVAFTTWEVLSLAQRIHALSEGVFDPCLPCRPGRVRDLMISEPGTESPWALCRAPLALDLGGIAKGYAIDRAIEALRVAGCTSGLVNAGGDLRTYGRSETVLLRRRDGSCVPLTLKDEALAVSDLDADPARRPPEHRGYYCRSGEIGAVNRYAAVGAASAAIADALTKCVLLAGERCAARALCALDARRIR